MAYSQVRVCHIVSVDKFYIISDLRVPKHCDQFHKHDNWESYYDHPKEYDKDTPECRVLDTVVPNEPVKTRHVSHPLYPFLH